MAERRSGGKKRPPNPAPQLLDRFRQVIAGQAGRRLVLAGKSMGGRMASLLADEAGAAGLVCFGYPFHPPGKPGKLRTEHLKALKTPTLILQGERDPFGTREEVPGYGLSSRIRVVWIPDGNHDLAPRKASGWSREAALAKAAEEADAFLKSL
jgi:predicted alpha/beta-hydrolase family hydrolase